MKRSLLYIPILLLTLFTVFSCTKVVNINLNDSAPKLIIEGNISDQISSCSVKLTKSINFNLPNTFPAVTGSVLTITDDIGNTSLLIESAAGYYTSPLLKGNAGRTYTINITSEGQTYTAISSMADHVSIDTISQEIFITNGFGGYRQTKFVRIQYKDPAGKSNYYRFVEIINGNPTDIIYIDSDLLRDGNTITQDLFRRDLSLETGDTVQILLQTIDKEVYNYFAQLNQLTSDFGGQNASPANPVSNFNNGALGYFSAYSVRSKSIVIK